MKITHILLATFILFITSCKKDDDETQNPLDALPPATQIGAQTFGCLVNGEIFLPKKFGQNSLNAFYQNMNGLYTLSISSESGEINTESQFIVIGGISVPAVEEQTYNLTSDKIGNFTGLFTDNGLNDSAQPTSDLKPGKLIITNHDTENFIISGNFEFTILDKNNKKIKVTNGRFDVKYTN